MDLKKFINYNSECPMCSSKLTLCMYLSNSNFTKLFVLDSIKGDSFFRFKDYLDHDSFSDLKLNKEIKLTFNNNELNNNKNDFIINFISICNISCDSIVIDDNLFDINPHYACYFRSSPCVKFIGDSFSYVDILDCKKINCEEIVKISDCLNNTNKYYILSLTDDKYTLYYYCTNDEQENDEYYIPNVTLKEIPPFKIDLKNKSMLLSKLESCLLLS